METYFDNGKAVIYSHDNGATFQVDAVISSTECHCIAKYDNLAQAKERTVNTMRTKTVNVYTYGELSQTAKDKVKQWLDDGDSFALTESLESDLSDHHGIPNAELSYSLGYCQGDGVSFTGSWSGEELKDILSKVYDGKVPLKMRLLSNNLTIEFRRRSHHYYHAYTIEVYFDSYVYSDRLAEYIDEQCKIIDYWRISICKDLEKTGYAEIEYRNSEEAMEETCEADGYEFYENGDLA